MWLTDQRQTANTDKTRNKLPTTDRKNINQRTWLKQSRQHIRFHCNQMINLRGMKNCYPCIEFKLCELIKEHLLLTCFLIINLDLPTIDKGRKF